MTVEDFRRIALSFAGTSEGKHMGQPDFRAEGRVFAYLPAAAGEYGSIKLSHPMQSDLVQEWPDCFRALPDASGRMGMTQVSLDAVQEHVLRDTLQFAWRLAVQPRHPRAKG